MTLRQQQSTSSINSSNRGCSSNSHSKRTSRPGAVGAALQMVFCLACACLLSSTSHHTVTAFMNPSHGNQAFTLHPWSSLARGGAAAAHCGFEGSISNSKVQLSRNPQRGSRRVSCTHHRTSTRRCTSMRYTNEEKKDVPTEDAFDLAKMKAQGQHVINWWVSGCYSHLLCVLTCRVL